jgi:hypothetical protein
VDAAYGPLITTTAPCPGSTALAPRAPLDPKTPLPRDVEAARAFALDWAERSGQTAQPGGGAIFIMGVTGAVMHLASSRPAATVEDLGRFVRARSLPQLAQELSTSLRPEARRIGAILVGMAERGARRES